MKFTKEDVKKACGRLDVSLEDYSFEELYTGVAIELEHGTTGNWNLTNDDLKKTIKIALAHLDEIPDYYTRLTKMESDAQTTDDVMEVLKSMTKVKRV